MRLYLLKSLSRVQTTAYNNNIANSATLMTSMMFSNDMMIPPISDFSISLSGDFLNRERMVL